MTDDELSPRVVTSARLDDDDFEVGLRPRTLDAYIGQKRLRENLEVAIAATRQRWKLFPMCCFMAPRDLERRR